MRLRQRLLIVDHCIIDRQAKQNGREAHAHHVNGAENQSAQRQRAAQRQRQQRQQPEHRFDAPVRQPEEQRDNRSGAAHRNGDVVLHAHGCFGHKGWTASVTHLGGLPRRCQRSFHYRFDPFQPLVALAIRSQFSARLNKQQAKLAVCRTEHFLLLAKSWRRASGAFRQTCQAEWVIAQPGDFLRRKRCRQFFACGGKRRTQRSAGQAIGQVAKNFGRLIKPEITDQFRGLVRMLEPGRFPHHCSHEIRLLAQAFGDAAGCRFGLCRVRCLQRDDEFARVSKVLLINPQTLDCRQIPRQQIEHFHVESKPRQAERYRRQQQQPHPAARVFKHRSVHWLK